MTQTFNHNALMVGESYLIKRGVQWESVAAEGSRNLEESMSPVALEASDHLSGTTTNVKNSRELDSVRKEEKEEYADIY